MKLTLTSLALLTIFISWLFSVQPLCSLCLCGCFFEQFLTTETQRTQRLHREEVRKRLFVFTRIILSVSSSAIARYSNPGLRSVSLRHSKTFSPTQAEKPSHYRR